MPVHLVLLYLLLVGARGALPSESGACEVGNQLWRRGVERRHALRAEPLQIVQRVPPFVMSGNNWQAKANAYSASKSRVVFLG
jgi:hypothetical protein